MEVCSRKLCHPESRNPGEAAEGNPRGGQLTLAAVGDWRIAKEDRHLTGAMDPGERALSEDREVMVIAVPEVGTGWGG